MRKTAKRDNFMESGMEYCPLTAAASTIAQILSFGGDICAPPNRILHIASAPFESYGGCMTFE